MRAIAERDDLIPLLGEIFREHGYSGTSLSRITERTGLGKGSLYHFFPRGKQEMAEAVLDDVQAWFEANVFEPLRGVEDPRAGIGRMFSAVQRYFDHGRRICLVGAFALDHTRDQFGARINGYFTSWTRALALALERAGFAPREARDTAEDVVAEIQGALVLARAQNDPKVFARTLRRLRERAGFEARG